MLRCIGQKVYIHISLPKCEIGDLTTHVLVYCSWIIIHTVISNKSCDLLVFSCSMWKDIVKYQKISRTVGKKQVNVINDYSKIQPVGGITDLPNACELGKESNFLHHLLSCILKPCKLSPLTRLQSLQRSAGCSFLEGDWRTSLCFFQLLAHRRILLSSSVCLYKWTTAKRSLFSSSSVTYFFWPVWTLLIRS